MASKLTARTVYSNTEARGPASFPLLRLSAGLVENPFPYIYNVAAFFHDRNKRFMAAGNLPHPAGHHVGVEHRHETDHHGKEDAVAQGKAEQ
jgi:hypothetical protein